MEYLCKVNNYFLCQCQLSQIIVNLVYISYSEINNLVYNNKNIIKKKKKQVIIIIIIIIF